MRNSHKLIIGLVVGLGILIQVGDNIDNPPVRVKRWLPPVREINKHTHKPTKASKYSTRPWESAKKDESEEWLDFIEELDNRGINVWDPDAEDIWEENY